MGKQKRNQDTTPTEPGWFVPGVLDFVADLPLDECAARLEDLDHRGWFGPTVRVTVTPVDEDTYQFYVKRIAGRYANNAANGCLKRWGETATLVTGDAWVVTSQVKLSIILFVVSWLFIIAIAISQFLWVQALFLTVWMGLYVALTLHDTRRKPYTLAAMIEDELCR